MKLGFLGPIGTFSEQAANFIKSGEKIAYKTIDTLILAVENEEIDCAVVPFENSVEGAINITIDMLAYSAELRIINEIDVKICHNLISNSSEIKKIISHEQAVAQCSKFISANYNNATIEFVSSTSKAVEISSKIEGVAAIASKTAAHNFNVKIIKENIQDFDNNITKFILVAKKIKKYADLKEASPYKTAIVFQTEQNRPGSLYKILGILDLFDINMTKILSRPNKGCPGQYIFFIEVEGHSKDLNFALDIVKNKTLYYKNLGSYTALGV